MPTIKLKNGKKTKDIRLARVPFFDERSRGFNIADVATSTKLRSYTWRCNSWFDQGSEGACVGFAFGHEMAARPSEVQGITKRFLRRKLYWEAQKIDPWQGGAYPGASPFYEGTSVLAGAKIVQQLGFGESYRWAFSPTDAMYGIGHNGPAVIGVNWYKGMLETDENGFIHPTGRLAGGHAILVRAINIREEYVVLRNSWGKKWGIMGDCKLSLTDFARLLDEDGECCFMLKRKTNVKV